MDEASERWQRRPRIVYPRMGSNAGDRSLSRCWPWQVRDCAGPVGEKGSRTVPGQVQGDCSPAWSCDDQSEAMHLSSWIPEFKCDGATQGLACANEPLCIG